MVAALRLHVAARQGEGRVFQPGARDFSDLSQSQCAADHRQRGAVGDASGGLYLGKGRNIKQPLSPIAAEHVVDESLHRGK